MEKACLEQVLSSSLTVKLLSVKVEFYAPPQFHKRRAESL